MLQAIEPVRITLAKTLSYSEKSLGGEGHGYFI
jgi:hypothetical protein